MSGSRDPGTLHPVARRLFEIWLGEADAEGLEPLAYCFERDLRAQARLYRTNRPRSAIERGHARLVGAGLLAPAEALLDVGPQPGTGGRKKTNALPGTSFHQAHLLDGIWGALAWDWVPMVDGKPAWNRWDLYERGALIAESHGLTPGLRFTTFREGPHIQFDDGRQLTGWELALGSFRA